jgi:hypothetical protein
MVNMTPTQSTKILKPQAPYVLTWDELNTFLSQLGSLKVPIDYGASLAKHVANKKLGSMKTHDYHLLMQKLLPLCLRGLMAFEPQMATMWLSCVFHWVCVKVWNPNEIGSLQEDVAFTIYLLKKKFPPTFFDIMIHLLLHIVDELEILGGEGSNHTIRSHTCPLKPLYFLKKIFRKF